MIVAVSLILDVVFLTFATAFDSSRLMVVTQLLQRSVSAASGVECLHLIPGVAMFPRVAFKLTNADYLEKVTLSMAANALQYSVTRTHVQR